jgi:simple sugar transport system ATP-binding protein
VKVVLQGIHKRFGSVQALAGVDLEVPSGAIHALLGENGAGKSTLMKVLSGYHAADSGRVLLDDREVTLRGPADAIARGVGMLHQDPLDFPALSVIDSYLLGSPGPPWIRRATARRELADIAERLDFHFDPSAPVATLTVGERQQLEIVRLLSLGVRVLILDEPTTAISAQQRTKLFTTLRRLARDGLTVLFVSHKLEEIQQLCDAVTVLRRGRVVARETLPCPTERLVRSMFGEPIQLPPRRPAPPGPTVLRLHKLHIGDWRLEVQNLDLEVHAGEVIGLAGLTGSGQELLLRACAGLLRPTAGEIHVAGERLDGRPYRRFLRAGVAFAPADRLQEALIPGLTIAEHLALARPAPKPLIHRRRIQQLARHTIDAFQIKGHPDTPVEQLSGGNQQRTLLGLLPEHLRLLLLEHPTRGLDIESAAYVWRRLQERTEQGTAVIFASSDLEELLTRSDRILVFFSGKVHCLQAGETTSEELGERIGGKGFRETVAPTT